MKTIKNILIVLSATLFGISLQDCNGLSASALTDTLNSRCPTELGKGVIMQSVETELNSIVCNVKVEGSLDALKTMQEEVKSAYIQSLKSQAQSDNATKHLLEMLENSGTLLVYRYEDSNGKKFETVVTDADLK